MQTYYNGKIISDSKIKEININIGKYDEGVFNFDYSYLKKDDNKINILKDYLLNKIDLIIAKNSKVQEEYIKKLINSIISIELLPKVYQEEQEIIYEKVVDQYENIYGKELVTGLIFPISNEKSKNIEYYINYYEEDNAISLSIQFNHKINTIEKCHSLIIDEQIADNEKVRLYLNDRGKSRDFFKKIKEEKIKKEFVSSITKLYNENNFITKPKIGSLLKDESSDNIVIETIKCYLIKLEKIDKELYKEYNEKFKMLINHKNYDIKTLISFSKELEYYLMLKKSNNTSLEEYLESKVQIYLNNIYNENNLSNDLDLEKIDKIQNDFLKNKDKYFQTDQRKIFNYISFLYLMEVYEHIDSISYHELKESYFVNNLKRIVLIIEFLKKTNIIKNNFETIFKKELNLENVLEIIRIIEFNYLEETKVKSIIKKL